MSHNKLSNNTKNAIKSLIVEKIKNKISDYKAETTYSPFFEAMFGRRTIINASIMQSLYTSFGMSIYEQTAVILAKAAGYHAERQYILLGNISNDTELLINDFCKKPLESKQQELLRIKEKSSAIIVLNKDQESVVDVYIKKPNKEIYIDITTVKPNLKEFQILRKKMLRWSALRYSQGSTCDIITSIGIPYNPYHPDKYQRWTGSGCHPEDLLVQNELWSECAGFDVYDELIDIFVEIGSEMKIEIEKFIKS